MKLPKLRELAEAVKALTHPAYTSKFPFEPHEPYPSFRGQPEFNDQKCLGCLACEEICPAEAIGHEDLTDGETPVRKMIHFTDSCIFCGSCEAVCIADNEGITLTRKWDLAFFDRAEAFETIEKDLQLCEVCGAVAACKDHLVWIAERVGELSYSSPTLYQSQLKALGIMDGNIAAVMKDFGRSDRVKILCARCRRERTLTTA